jgi:hypothetical protein
MDVSGPDFVSALGKRKPEEKILFREDRSGHYCLDCYRMEKTQSAFKKIGSLRTATNNITADEAALLRRQASEEAWARPFLK